jgi:PAS domain S-box-containing protein
MNKILLIEDDAGLLESTKEFLTEEGFEVLEATTGLQGFQRATRDLPDLIICDISLPEMDGYEIFTSLQQHQNTCLIPFIFLTARAERDDIRAGMQLGVDDYITKPFDFDELLTSIRVRLAKRMKQIKIESSSFHDVGDSLLTGYFILNHDIISYVNMRMAKILGYKASEITGHPLVQFIADNDKELIESKIRQCLRGIQATFHARIHLVGNQDNKIEIELACSLVQIKGQPSILGNVLEIKNESLDNIDINFDNPDSDTLNQVVELLLERKDTLSDDLRQHIVDTLTRSASKLVRKVKEVNLSSREKEVLDQVCLGLTNQDIAEKLFISQRTVDSHRANLLSKTGCENTAQLIVFAIRNNLVKL